jgi:hypothetical protein
MASFSILDKAADDLVEQMKRLDRVVRIDLKTGPYLSNGMQVNWRWVNRLIERGLLVPDADGLFGDQPQTYHLTEVD